MRKNDSHKVEVNENFITVPEPTAKFCFDVMYLTADDALFKHYLHNMKLLGASIIICQFLFFVVGIVYWVKTSSQWIGPTLAILVWIMWFIEKFLFKKLEVDYKRHKNRLKCCMEQIKESGCYKDVQES